MGLFSNWFLPLLLTFIVATASETESDSNSELDQSQTDYEAQVDNATEATFARDSRQQGACTYQHTFSNVGEWVYLNSENYPNSYPPNLNCRYNLFSPRGTQMTMQCDDFNVEASQNCQYDMFYWSVKGDPNFSDRQYACGQGTLSTKTSVSNSFVIGFRSDDSNPSSSTAFRYRCKVSVVPTPCSCGRSAARSRIVGGTEAKIGEFPWRVALFTNQVGQFCSATLISNSWILTAAHCVNELQSGDTIYADIGDHDLSSVDDTPNQVIAVDRIIKNSLYNDQNQDSDTALLHLSRPVVFSQTIQPLCLPWKFTSSNFQGTVGTVSGWGTLYFGGPQSNKLLRTDLDVLSTENCRQKYSDRPSVEITNNMICAQRAGKDTCQADSGGSLDYFDPSSGQNYGIGVVSYGFGCADSKSPGVYARTAMFLGWIEQNSQETFCKT